MSFCHVDTLIAISLCLFSPVTAFSPLQSKAGNAPVPELRGPEFAENAV